ncbi:hypothetical protein B9Z19DRAFT_1068584 [Tuber borchii]|uniref:Uncharacterized protein n=1 Tax=Tuber borchii TaxID=42251 RepID=A0A2T6ZEP3_TUBBO|nr:hypothetical protein B9Z19DRAFT_1068584 [Tuber borchii]
MEDLPVGSSLLSPEEQARILQERHQTKVKGSSRLNRITRAQGQTFCIEELSQSLLGFFKPFYSNRDYKHAEIPAVREATPDPPDLDISADYYKPKTRQQGPPPSPLRSSSLAKCAGTAGSSFRRWQ